MKNTLKWLGIITILLIGVSLIACSGTNSKKSGKGWPPQDVREQFNIGDMQAPAGSNFEWAIVYGTLGVKFNHTTASGTDINTWLSNNGWSGIMGSYMKEAFVAHYENEGNLASFTVMNTAALMNSFQ